MSEEFGEDEGVELARAVARFKSCRHDLVSEIRDELTYDGRRIKKKITTCRRCGYYDVEVLERETVSEEARWR